MRMEGLTVTVMVPVGVVPGGDVMVPLTVTGALAAGSVGVTVCVTDVAPVGGGDGDTEGDGEGVGVGDGGPPITVRSVARLAMGDAAPAPALTRLDHMAAMDLVIVHDLVKQLSSAKCFFKSTALHVYNPADLVPLVPSQSANHE